MRQRWRSLSSMRRTSRQFVTAECHKECDPNRRSPGIASNPTACALIDAFSFWQSRCTDNARHGTKRHRQETAIARVEKCIPKSNIEGQQRKDRYSPALAPVLGDQEKYVSRRHPVPDIRHPGISTSEWAVCPRRSKRRHRSRPRALRSLRAASNATCSATGAARERRWLKKASPSISSTSLICKQTPLAEGSKLKLGGKELVEPSTLISIVSSRGRASVFTLRDSGSQVSTWGQRLEPLPIRVIS